VCVALIGFRNSVCRPLNTVVMDASVLCDVVVPSLVAATQAPGPNLGSDNGQMQHRPTWADIEAFMNARLVSHAW
jgi:hypothetical protein